jgi:hypothetical protein
VQRYQIEAHDAGLLYFDGVLQRTLKPGAYDFWRGPVQVKVEKVDLRQLQVDMDGRRQPAGTFERRDREKRPGSGRRVLKRSRARRSRGLTPGRTPARSGSVAL